MKVLKTLKFALLCASLLSFTTSYAMMNKAQP